MVPGESSSEQEKDEPDPEFVEVDPTGRYARYPEILGKGAFKTVYKAFDELEGIEVAWNQVKLADVLRNVNDLERLYSEVHLLKTLKHKNIIKFYNSWVDTKKDNINFITEVFTSGNLRQYRNKHKHVDLRALKNWSRQILSGLCYLHSNDPPIIHRDLKCDNIFVNGNQGEVKLGDLGLAAILQHADSAHSVLGTPEFMAPELYEEEYNELVDVYAFGMCLLELVTFEYPYSECINAAQIYKRVIGGVKPGSLARVNDSGVRQFIEKCIAHVSERLSARELLMDPFLQLDADKESIGCSPRPDPKHSDIAGQSNVHDPIEPSMTSRDFTVEGQRKEANTIFLKLRIADSTGHVRNIHFPFDIEADTSISVATEMVAELDLTDQDVSTIAAIIDAEIQAHIPGWMQGETSDGNCDNEKTVTDVFDSEAVDEVAALPNEAELPSGVLVLERLPSGRRYWSDSPKGTSSESPTGPTQSNISSELNPRAGDDLLSGVYEEIDNSSPSVNKGKGKLQDVEASTSFISGNPLSHDVIRNKPNAISNGSDLGDHAIGAITNGRANNDEASLSELLENQSEDVKQVVQTLETLFGEQHKEFLELKKKHDMAVAEILKGLHPEIQSRALKVCHKTVPPYMVSSEEEWQLKSP